MGRNLAKGIVVIGVMCFCMVGWSFLVEAIAEKGVSAENHELIRLHVLANSDSPEDQRLKLLVRDAVLSYLAPLVEHVEDKRAVKKIILDNKMNLLQTASETLLSQGVYYPVDIEYGVFDFPIKAYGQIVVPSGQYEAVRVLIGEAEGANWWCVLFPPLCFVEESQVVSENQDIREEMQSVERSLEFRSKIAEWIKSL